MVARGNVRERGGPILSVLLVALLACGQAFAWSGEIGGRPVELSGYLETRQVFRTDRDTPHELNQQRLQLQLRSALSEWISLEIVSSLQNGGPATRETRGGFYNIDDVFQSVAPAIEIEEAFLSFELGAVGLRLGQIKHSWGKLDRYQPNDVLNPERFADPVLLEEHERKIGVPSLELSYFLPALGWLPEEATLRAVVVPRYIPFRLPLAGERWFPPNAVPPETFAIGPDGARIDIPLSIETRNTSPPAFTFENVAFGGSFAAYWRGLDYSLYYYHGLQTAPVLRLDARGEVVSAPPGVRGVTTLTPVFEEVDTWGADLAFTLGRFGFRAEAAYTRGRAFNRDLLSLLDDPDLDDSIAAALEELAAGASSAAVDLGDTYAVSDAIQWGAGFDTHVADFDLIFEVSQTDVLESTDTLLIKDTETVLLGDVRRSFLRDDLTLQLISIYGASSDYTVLMPRVTYRWRDRVEIRAGYVHIAGRARSRLGQYKDNDEAFVRLRFLL